MRCRWSAHQPLGLLNQFRPFALQSISDMNIKIDFMKELLDAAASAGENGKNKGMASQGMGSTSARNFAGSAVVGSVAIGSKMALQASGSAGFESKFDIKVESVDGGQNGQMESGNQKGSHTRQQVH